ncbi:MAG: DUF4908 domain-containing protein [Alphaproteobacteria bacterium]|nr:DUF4908 domain-containing protein [Alphaproteobacteria bacterium]
MPNRGIAILFCALISCTLAMPVGAEMNDRLSEQHFGWITTGDYQAGDSLHFSLDRYRNEYLMRFDGQPEVYVLYADYGSLGGRVLRYDSGSIAIQVAGWGSMTIYTDNQPEGLPAVRTGDSTTPSLPAVTLSQMQSAADDETAHLSYVRGTHVTFTADWNALSGDAGLRALAFDTMENAARGIDRFTANPAAHALFGQKVNAVRIQTSDKPIIQIINKTLIVTFNPSQGYMGRASSRAIAFALGKLFGVPIPN